MSYRQPGQPPQLGATFVPGGFDDYYMPVVGPEVISPAPQRIMPEVPENMQENLQAMELDSQPLSPSGHHHYNQSGQFPPQQQQQQQQQQQSASYQAELAQANSMQNAHHHHQQQQQQPQQQQGSWPQRQQSISSAFKQQPTVQPQSIQPQQSHDYNQFANQSEIPNFSIFPKLHPRPPNVPPSDDEKEAVLENARLPVLNSNDPEMQLAWAQDALAYVDAALLHEQRVAEIQGARPATPAVEHQLKVDAMNIVSFLADQHHPKAEFMRGMWLEFGKFGLRNDKKEAFRCYTRAAQKGYSRAEYRMGMQFEQSNDPIKALQHYKQGSEAGDSASNYRLGMMTLLGQHGQPQDYARGIALIRQAASTADENAPQGAYVLGMLQARELPQINVPEIYLPYDEKAARMNIEKAAYLGFAKAQLKMGSAYELCSLGCEFNPTLSLHYNALASRQGEADADMAISKWFLCGYEGEFPKNEELAYQYAQRAAATGLATAEFAMGYFNEIGMHIPVNLDKALEWYNKASQNGNQDAAARIESIYQSRTLSKKDHENVAISKIKSQHGSMRGQRPARLAAKAAAPPLPPIVDNSPSDYGDSPAHALPPHALPVPASRLPDRNASTTPYPLSDKPPQIMASAPYERPATSAPSPYDRNATTTPYPMDNGPPRISTARPGLAGGFAPELRSASARPTSAFQINPNVYGPGPGLGPGPGHGPGPQNGYPRDRLPSQGGRGMAPLPLRPHTSIDDMGQGRGRLPSQQRAPSAGLPPGPGAYRQPGGPGADRPDPRSQTTKPPDIGFVAPADTGRNKLQKQAPNQPGAPLKKQATLPDIGFVAPLETRQHTRPSTVQPGQESRASSRPERPPTTAPANAPRPSSRPSSSGRQAAKDPMPQPPAKSAPKPSNGPAPPSKINTNQPPAAQAVQSANPATAKPAGAKPQAAKPAAPSKTPSTPGNGPKTFDEMGIGQAQKDNDCVVM